MTRLISIAALTAVALCAQKTELPPGYTFKVYTLKYARAETLQRLLSAFGVNIQRSDNTVAVSGPAEAMKAVDEAVKVLDTSAAAQPPHKSIQLTGYMVLASAKGGEAGVPADLEPVIKQLRTAFPYVGYRLLDSFILRIADDARNSFVNGLIPSFDPQVEQKIMYQFRVPSADMQPDNTMRLGNLLLELKVPDKIGRFEQVTMSSSVEIREGQKVVVGKSSLGSSDSAFFLVLTARILD